MVALVVALVAVYVLGLVVVGECTKMEKKLFDLGRPVNWLSWIVSQVCGVAPVVGQTTTTTTTTL